MRTIEEIAAGIAEGLEPWLGHDAPCLCVTSPFSSGHSLSLIDAVFHAPMCGRCTCGLRDALMAEAISTATDDEVVAYVRENGEDVDAVAAHVRTVLRSAWRGFMDRKTQS